MSTGKPPVGSFGRRKAVSRAESAASQESLQAAMDLEVAIGTSTVQNNARSSIEGTKPDQVHDLHAMCPLCSACPINKVPDFQASEIKFAQQDLGLCSEPPAATTNVASKSFLSSNSLAERLVSAARARHMEWLAAKSEREAAEEELKKAAEAKAAEHAKSKSANNSRMGSRGSGVVSRDRTDIGSRGAGRGRQRVSSEQQKGKPEREEEAPATRSGPAEAESSLRGHVKNDASADGGVPAEQDMRLITEGSYSEINERYGLPGERVMRYELVGVGREKIAQLRSLFISLDEDGGGELGPLELYEALIKFGQNVTDKQVKQMMEEVDADNSGTIGFEEFLMLAVPGASSGGPKVKREFSIAKYVPSSFEDTAGERSDVEHTRGTTLQIPRQCFYNYDPQVEFVPEQIAAGSDAISEHQEGKGSDSLIDEKGDPWSETGLEMRLRFKIPNNQKVTEAASHGNIEKRLEITRHSWLPKRYLFGKKELAPRDGKGAGLVFTIPDSSEGETFPKTAKNKHLGVQFPGSKKEVTLYEGCPKLRGFPILQMTETNLRINFEIPFGGGFKSMAHLAEFPPPIEHLTILSCGAGSLLNDLRKIVAAQSFLPPWYPFSFSTMCPDDSGKTRRIDLRRDLSELENLPKGNVCLDVYLPKDEMVASLIHYDARQYPWIADMESIDFQTSMNVMTEITFRGGSANFTDIARPMRLGLKLTEQVEQKSWQKNRGWISCPPHPHVVTLLLSANANVFISPYIEGVSGDLIASILDAALLNANQKRVIIIKIGLHVAWAVEHMHDQGIWHLDLKPSNLLITIDDSDPDKPRFWQQIHVRVCDYSRCSARACSNMSRRGTVGYWSPEQVHDRTNPGTDPDASLYWGLKKSDDPPPASQADMTSRSDSWGWATMMLGLMGRLEEMRKTGYQKFLQNLLNKGFVVDLSAIFLYEQQAFIDLVQSELDGVQAVYTKIKQAWTKLSEDIERHRMDLDPVWQTAVKALEALEEKDLKQLRDCRRASPTVKLLNDAISAILEIERKTVSDWANFKMVLASSDFVTAALKFDKDKGLTIQASKDLARVYRNPEFQIESYVDSNVPNADPTSPGSALATATAYFQWVTAVNQFNLLRRTVGPIQAEMKQREDEMKRLDPKIAKLQDKIAAQTAELDALKQRLDANCMPVIDLVRGAEKEHALLEIKKILEMNNTLTNQQFKQLQRDCLYCTGDHAQVFRLLSWLNRLPVESSLRKGQQAPVRAFSAPAPTIAPSVRTVMDDLYDKYACLRATRPKEHEHGATASGAPVRELHMSRTGSGVSDFGSQAQSVLSSNIPEDDETLGWDHFPTTRMGIHYLYETSGDPVPAQHKRQDLLGKHSKGDGVGDTLSLVLAWCLQHQPVDRMPIHSVAAVLMQLSPGQEWLHKGTVPGKAGLARPSLDTDEAFMAALAAAPRLAAAMIGDRNDPIAELCLMERKAATALKACEFMKASHFFTDLVKKLESHDDEEEYWMLLARAKIGMSDTRLQLGDVHEADTWLQSALVLVAARQSEDPAVSSRADVCLYFHQADVENMSKRGKLLPAEERSTLIQQRLLWADAKIQEAAVLIAKTTENGENLYFSALEILLRVATVLQETLGPESRKVAAVLRTAGQVQALRGRFRDALDIFKRALRIETRATGYDGYAAHPSIADMLHSMAEVDIVLGKHAEAIGLVERAINIYSATDCDGPGHSMIPKLKECLGRAYQGCLRYGDASRSFQDAFDCSCRRVLLKDIHPLTQAADFMQKGACALVLAQHSLAYEAYLEAAAIYRKELAGMNWLGDKLEDNSEMVVADCLLGAGAAQNMMGNRWKALEYYQEAYQHIFNRTKDEHHLAMAGICEQMATCYISMDKKGIALDWLKRAVDIRELCQGMSHVDLAHTLTRISAVLRSARSYQTAQAYTTRALHIYVAVFERNHICVAEALENLAVCRFPPTAQDYNSELRRHATLKLQVESSAARVLRCERRAEAAKEALVKQKKTPGIRKAALKDTEDRLEHARNEVSRAKTSQEHTITLMKLREEKVKHAKATCEECLDLVHEAVAIVKDILPDPCQKLTNLMNGSKKMAEMLHSLLGWAEVHASKAHTEVSSPPDSPLSSGTGQILPLGGLGSTAPSTGVPTRPTTAKSAKSVTVMDAIGEDLSSEMMAFESATARMGTNPAIQPTSTPRSGGIAPTGHRMPS